MKQIIQRRISNMEKTIPILDNKRVVEIYKDKLNILKELLEENNALKKIETLNKRSNDIKYIMLIFGSKFEYTESDLVDLMLVVTNFTEEELIDFMLEVRPTDVEDYKQENPDFHKYFK